jgi:hypothetical protein
VAQVPDGYEIYEKPGNAQVFLRKVEPTLITPEEREIARMEASRASSGFVLVDVDNRSIIVYFAQVNEGLIALLSGHREVSPSAMLPVLDYEKLLRFTLVDLERRLFHAERWCFRGSIDDWIPLSGMAPLGPLVAKYARHLGRESFFELY